MGPQVGISFKCVCAHSPCRRSETQQVLGHTDARSLGATYSPDTWISYPHRLTRHYDSELLRTKPRAMLGWGLGGDEPEILSPARNPGLPLPASLDAHPTPTRVMMFPFPFLSAPPPAPGLKFRSIGLWVE